MARVALALTILLILAGCAGADTITTPPDTATTPTTSTAPPTTKTSTTPTTTTTTPSTTTTSPEPRYRNPWQKETITVAVVNDANTRNITPLVQKAIEFWETNSTTYGTYNANYTLVDLDDRPDILVRFVPTIEACGANTTTEPLGCAPVLRPDSTPRQPEIIRIRAGYTDQSTLETIKHEFGHTLGLGHDDDPQPLMAARGDSNTLPIENASETRYPWRTTNFTLYVEDGSGWSDREARRESNKFIEYWESGANGWLDQDLNITRVDSAEKADIVIRFDTGENCGYQNGGVCGRVYGYDYDADPALEFYGKTEIIVTRVDPDEGGWFAAYYFAYYVGGQTRQLPFELRSQGNAPGFWYN